MIAHSRQEVPFVTGIGLYVRGRFVTGNWVLLFVVSHRRQGVRLAGSDLLQALGSASWDTRDRG